MKKKVIGISVVLFSIVLLIVLFNSIFIINEYETGVLRRFGDIQTIYVNESSDQMLTELNSNGYGNVSVIEGAGLRFKMPFIDTVTVYDARLMTYETPSRSIITLDKKRLIFDNNAQWRITNPALFSVKMVTISNAQKLIDDVLYAAMNHKVGQIDAHTLITDREEISKMLEDLASETSGKLQSYGVEVFDVRIKRTDLPKENYSAVFDRMITERNRIAMQYRSEGAQEALAITSNTDYEVTKIVSVAQKQAEIIKGEGDAQAAAIYSNSYSKDPEFYEFYNMLNTYVDTLGKSSTLVIPLESDFAKYLLTSK